MHLSPVPDEQRIEDAARGLLRGIGRLSQALFRSGEFGLPRSHVAVLDALEPEARRVTGIAAYTGIAQPRVTVVLQELEERGLIERERCSRDRRVVEASLTPAGAELLERARQRMAAALLEGLRSSAAVDDPERSVGLARDAVSTLLHAVEPEVS
ncbi:MarR family transcriptional regulator [Streptomyces sp. NBC_01267]|uniref:MarR family winged helix-turn-helix transcriptional regulator n=1 Tax=unclassified Streptomyces TaxID=2593676 RepID=UPI00202455BE|nr:MULTISPECIES: MarR family transcriptional regulator [unclassified Streptomyces]WSC23397.1 MarR family transcriptional regulator [Streptomyces sp. NBC_01766]WSV57307.1 MarR family transcriptional regulator [Streptomyces sp. NBC_01014]